MLFLSIFLFNVLLDGRGSPGQWWTAFMGSEGVLDVPEYAQYADVHI